MQPLKHLLQQRLYWKRHKLFESTDTEINQCVTFNCMMNCTFSFMQSSRGTGKVHSFGKRDHSIKRNLNIPVVVRGWLYKQASIWDLGSQSMFKSVLLWNISYVIEITFRAESEILLNFAAVWSRGGAGQTVNIIVGILYSTISDLFPLVGGSFSPCMWSLNVCIIRHSIDGSIKQMKALLKHFQSSV